MALTFTDDQIKELTQYVIDSPVLIAAANVGIANAVANKAKILAQDNQNAVYSLNWINIISQYHAEIKYLNGTQYTDYSTASIEPAGRLTDGNIHFITSPIWLGFQPKVHASSTGLPTSVWANTETEATNRITTNLSLLKTGFTDGAASSTTTGPYSATTGFPFTSATGFTVGNRVLFFSGSSFLLATIDTITGMDVKVTPITGTTASIASGATVKNFHSGFSFAQRESGTGSTTGDTAYMAHLKTVVDGSVTDWKTRLQAELSALNLNDATGAEKTQITSAKSIVNAHVAVISTWQGFPSTGSGTSRFGTNLPALETDITTRPAQLTARASEIVTALGSIAQNSDGSYTGTGNYFNLFDNLNVRLNKAGGTLRTFYDSDLGVQLFTQQIVTINSKVARDTQTFNTKLFTADATGTMVVKVQSTTGLTVGESVKIMSRTQVVITANITAILGNDITLDQIIPATYKSSESGRLVKQA